MDLHPIAELGRHHQGKVVVIDIKQWVCAGQWGRVWTADEGPDTRGTDDPNALRACGFTHFAFLSDVEAVERMEMERCYGRLTKAEEEYLALKYGRSAQQQGKDRA